MSLSNLSSFTSAMGLSVASLYIYAKSINITTPISIFHKVVTVIWCILWALLRVFTPPWIPTLMIRPITCIAFILFIRMLTKTKFETVVSAYLLSYGINYSILFLASVIIGSATAPFVISGNADSTVYNDNSILFLLVSVVITVLQLIIPYFIFKIRRFRKGFPFLFGSHAVIIALTAAGITLILVSFVIAPRDMSGNSSYLMLAVFGVIIIGIGIIIWVRRGIKAFYRKKMKERSVELLEKELAQKEDEIQRLTIQSAAIRIADHKVMHRLTVMERSVAALVEIVQKHDLSAKVSEELSIVADDIMRLSQEHKKEIEQTKVRKPLPTTKVKMIDDMFGYYSKLFVDNDIEFNIKVNGSILYMIEQIVSQSKLETMIGDHLENAQIAINAGNNSFRSIFVVLGLVENCYELSVIDSGIPFELDTLTGLGTGYITTHSDNGGSGIGFMTTFEAVRECGASVIISEKKTKEADFSKSVTVRFDGRNEYIVQTYRAGELKALCTGTGMPGNYVRILDSVLNDFRLDVQNSKTSQELYMTPIPTGKTK